MFMIARLQARVCQLIWVPHLQRAQITIVSNATESCDREGKVGHGGARTVMSACFPGAMRPSTSESPRSLDGAVLHKDAISEAFIPRDLMPSQVPGRAYCKPATHAPLCLKKQTFNR